MFEGNTGAKNLLIIARKIWTLKGPYFSRVYLGLADNIRDDEVDNSKS